MAAEIPLTNTDQTALIDAEDLDWARARRWCRARDGYVISYPRNGERSTLLHRLLLGEPNGQVHHKNDNKLDCRRVNLQTMSHGEHSGLTNRHRGPTRGRFKGVSFSQRHKKWNARIGIRDKRGRPISLGYHDSEEEAAVVYDAAVVYYWGGDGHTNLIDLALL